MTSVIDRGCVEAQINELAKAGAKAVKGLGKESAPAALSISCLNTVLAVVECADSMCGEAAAEMLGACAECMSAVSDCLSACGSDAVESAKEQIARLVELSHTLDRVAKGGVPTDLGEKMIDGIIAGK